MTGAPLGRISSFYALYFGAVAIMIAWQAPYFESIGLSPTETGLLLGIVGFTKLVSPMIWGYIGDTIPQRVRLVQGGALMAAGLSWFLPEAQTFTTLAITLCSIFFFFDAILAQTDAITFEHLGEHGKVWYPRVRGIGSAGFVIVAITTGYWFEEQPLGTWPYWLMGLLGFMALVGLTLPKTAPHDPSEPPAAGFLKTLLIPSVASFFVAAFLIKLSTSPLNVFFTLYAIENGHPQQVAGWLWAAGVMVEVAIMFASTQLLAPFDPRKLMLFAAAVAVLRWPLIALGIESLPLMIFASALHGITFGVFHVGALQFLRQSYPRRQLGRGIALYSTLGFGLANMLGSPLSGLLYETGGGRLAFLAGGGVALVAFIVLASQVWKKRPERAG